MGVLGKSVWFAALAGSAASLVAGAASAASEARIQDAWRVAIARTPTPSAGCFTAAYPSTRWTRTACVVAPNRPYVPRTGAGFAKADTTGDGNDYAAVTSTLVSQGVGAFPVVTGVKTEKGIDGQNSYSLQLNSQFFASPACSGATNPQNCLGWEQFVYSNGGVAFMQYWLINYGSRCPAGGWMSYSGDCYRNSSAVGVPTQAISQLAHLKLSGAAVSGGQDTLVFTTASRAYSTTGADSVVTLAKYWDGAEFNVIGDGSGSEAKFNRGSSVSVNIALDDGSSAAPTCQANDGTTGETNNLNLGRCTTAGGASPSVTFTESN